MLPCSFTHCLIFSLLLEGGGEAMGLDKHMLLKWAESQILNEQGWSFTKWIRPQGTKTKTGYY